MFTCPCCGELMQILTNYHCVNKHGMTKKELVSKYGDSKYVTLISNKEINAWKNSFPQITNADFDIAQSSARTMIKR